MKVLENTKIPVKCWATDLEAEAEQQVRNLATLPFIHSHVAVMADAHAGRGSTVGTVIATKGAIIPAAVGVDIGCGMCALKLPLQLEELGDLKKLRHSIERAIPVGMNANQNITESAGKAFKALGEISEFAKSHHVPFEKSVHSIGSLGGGNHFIEICGDKTGTAWIVLHSGSRNIGKRLADIHIDKAKGLMKQYFISTPDADLAYLAQGTPEFDSYLHDLHWGQRFAMANRTEMMDRVLREVLYHTENLNLYKDNNFFRVNCHHNYTNLEHHNGQNVFVTRKGAVSARKDEWGIIPGSMGTETYIVQGKGNEDSFDSCSHGAGRRMSRTKAKQCFTREDVDKQTAGVECRKDSGVIDELPGSYKDINEVMKNQEDLVTPVFKLKQVICVKG